MEGTKSMAIRDTDGSIYRLHGPNPIMKTQELWDDSQITLINLKWTGEVVTDPKNPIAEARSKVRDISHRTKPRPKSTHAVPSRDFIKEVQKVEPAIKEEPAPVVINVVPEVAKVLQERGATFFCAPVIGFKEHNDDLYGTSYRTPTFGDQYTFDAIIIDQSDLQIQFWSAKEITKGSVVYQKAQAGEWERRWWEITQSEPKAGGFMSLGNISHLNPDFS